MKKLVTCFEPTKRSLLKLLLFILLLPNISTSYANNASYYVDKINGNDNNNGKSISKAWKTLNKLNIIYFKPGDKIFLKRGQSFNGSLFLKGFGLNGNQITLGAFGVGKRPVINSSGYDYSIQMLDAQYWEIADIETTGSDRAGIFIGCTKDDLVLNHFRITNCFIHDIGDDSYYAWDYCKLTGGIVIANGEIDKNRKPLFYNSLINDAIIDGCTIRYIKRWTCISISSGIMNATKGNANYIRNCTVEYSVADGIRMNGVQNSFIESSTMYKNGAWPKSPNPDWGGLGAWFFESDNCTIQFCEASYIDNWHNDGGAFDIDYYQKNSTIQYCYGHDCHGYGASVFGADASFPTENSIVRYNIFSNNARDSAYTYQGDIYVFTWNGGLLNGVKVYNNTSYWNPASDAAAFMCDADFTGTNPNIFKNNIIYSDHPQLAYLKNDSMQCDNNIYWVTNKGTAEWKQKDKKYYALSDWQNITGQDMHSKYTDPMLNNPTYHGNRIPTTQFNLKPGSPAINAGVDINDMGTRDFSGNPIPDKSGEYDIGAFELVSNTNNKKSKTKIGSKAPGFELATINNKKTKLNEFLGNTVLLSFISVHNSPEAGKAQAIRSQLAFIKSMKKQYGENGLKIILIDESSHINADSRDEMLINFIEDHELNDVVFLRDNKKENAAGKYGTIKFPTTFLISKDGSIKQKWGNVTLSSELAMAIENDLGDTLTIKHFDRVIAQQN
jgi:peroxiredoxin